MPEFVHRIRRAIRVLIRGFETEREDESPYTSTWTLRVRVEEDELDGGWVAECVDIPGCVSQGDTRDEAIENLADAVSGVISVRLKELGRDADPANVLEVGREADAADVEEHEFKIAVGA